MDGIDAGKLQSEVSEAAVGRLSSERLFLFAACSMGQRADGLHEAQNLSYYDTCLIGHHSGRRAVGISLVMVRLP